MFFKVLCMAALSHWGGGGARIVPLKKYWVQFPEGSQLLSLLMNSYPTRVFQVKPVLTLDVRVTVVEVVVTKICVHVRIQATCLN